MGIPSILRIIIITTITLFINLSAQKVNGQGTLKKLKDKIAKEIYNKTHPKPDSSGTSINNQKDSAVLRPNNTTNNNQTAVEHTTSIADPNYILANPKLKHINGFIPFNNKLIINYYETYETGNQLMEFDGTNFKEITNPLQHSSFTGQATIYNGKLILQFQVPKPAQNGFNYRMAKLDGETLNYIPDIIDDLNYPAPMGYLGSPIEYNKNLLVEYNRGLMHGGDEGDKLVKFNGTDFKVIDELGGDYAGSPIVYNNKLYFMLRVRGRKTLAVYDGTTTKSFLDFYLGEYVGFPFIYNNKLYFTITIAREDYRLATLNGNKIDTIPRPDPETRNQWLGPPVICDGKLYFISHNPQDGNSEFAVFNGKNLSKIPFKTDNVKVKLNHDNGNDEYKPPFLAYNNRLFFNYSNGMVSNYGNGVASFDGSTISMTDNPQKAAPFGIVYNNELYMMYYINTAAVDAKGGPVNITYLYKYDGLNFSLENQKTISGLSIVYDNKLYTWGSFWDGNKYVSAYWIW